jgi:hypothetical protein
MSNHLLAERLIEPHKSQTPSSVVRAQLALRRSIADRDALNLEVEESLKSQEYDIRRLAERQDAA